MGITSSPLYKFEIIVDPATGAATLTKFADHAEREGKRAGGALNESGKKAAGGLSQVVSEFNMLKTGVQLFAASAAVTGTIAFLKSCVTEAANAELNLVRLTNSLEHAGLGGKTTAMGIAAAAEELSHLTMLDQDAITGMMAVGIRMGLTTDQAYRLVQGAADAAAALGKGPESVAGVNEALARSISTGSAKALLQLGINLGEVKLQAGDAETVLKRLKEQFGGAAAAEMDTYAGKINRISKGWREFKEDIGNLALDPIVMNFLSGNFTESWNVAAERFENWAYKADLAAAEAEVKMAGMAKVTDTAAQAAKELMENVKGVVAQGGIDLGLDDDIEDLKEAKKSVAELVQEMLRAQMSPEAQAGRIVKAALSPAQLPTPSVGIQPYAPPVGFDETFGFGGLPSFESQQKAIEASAAYQEHLKNMSELMGENTESAYQLSDAFTMVAGAIAQTSAAYLVGAILGEKLSSKMLKATLKSIAVEATSRALFELAAGWASEAAYQPDKAAEHFAAAKIYGIVAGVSTAAAAAVGAGRSSESPSSEFSGKRSTSGLNASGSAGPTYNIQVNIENAMGGSNEEMARSIAESIRSVIGPAGGSLS